MLRFILVHVIRKMLKGVDQRSNLDWIMGVLHDAIHEECQGISEIERDGFIVSALNGVMDHSIEQVIDHKNELFKKFTDS